MLRQGGPIERMGIIIKHLLIDVSKQEQAHRKLQGGLDGPLIPSSVKDYGCDGGEGMWDA